MVESNRLNSFQVAQMQAAFDQAGLAAGGRLAGGLEVGALGPAPGVGDLALSASIRESTARGALARAGANQWIGAGAWTTVAWAGVAWDSDALWAGSQPTRLTVRSGGVYVVHAFVVWDAYAAGQVLLAVRKNGIEFARVNGVGANYQNVCALAAADENDYFDAAVYNLTGAGLNLLYYANLCNSLAAVRMA